jgi:hypothetical protein
LPWASYRLARFPQLGGVGIHSVHVVGINAAKALGDQTKASRSACGKCRLICFSTPVAAFQLALAAGNNAQPTLPFGSEALATFERCTGYSVS